MEVINIKGDDYEVINNEDGTISLKRYNHKTKMWVKLNFATEQDPDIEKTLTSILSSIYIKKVTGVHS